MISCLSEFISSLFCAQVIAWGFFWDRNSYLRDVWGLADGGDGETKDPMFYSLERGPLNQLGVNTTCQVPSD